MMRSLYDATFHVTLKADIELCLESAHENKAVTVQRHHGFVVSLLPCKLHPDCGVATLKHTGPPSCKCKEKPRVNDDAL